MFKNILVNALVNLGDVVLTTSALALIKRHFPDTRITMSVKLYYFGRENVHVTEQA